MLFGKLKVSSEMSMSEFGPTGISESSAYPLIRPTLWDHTVDGNKVERPVSPYVMDMSATNIADISSTDDREYVSVLAGISFKDNKEYKSVAAARKCILLHEDYERLYIHPKFGEVDLVWDWPKCPCYCIGQQIQRETLERS